MSLNRTRARPANTSKPLIIRLERLQSYIMETYRKTSMNQSDLYEKAIRFVVPSIYFYERKQLDRNGGVDVNLRSPANDRP